MFDVCTTGDTPHNYAIFKFLTRLNMGESIFLYILVHSHPLAAEM
jgi:hypothetical protein